MSNTIIGAPLHKGQQRVVKAIKSGVKHVTVVAPRQTGKSYLAMQVVLYWAMNYPGADIFWIAPIYRQAQKPFDEIFDAIHQSGVLVSANRSDMTMKFVNGSKIHFRSAERADNLRGNTATFCVVDEAAYMSDEVWKAVIRPMMLVKGRTILFISTPRGANWFKEMYSVV
jgi:phage terminase large subunit